MKVNVGVNVTLTRAIDSHLFKATMPATSHGGLKGRSRGLNG